MGRKLKKPLPDHDQVEIEPGRILRRANEVFSRLELEARLAWHRSRVVRRLPIVPLRTFRALAG